LIVILIAETIVNLTTFGEVTVVVRGATVAILGTTETTGTSADPWSTFFFRGVVVVVVVVARVLIAKTIIGLTTLGKVTVVIITATIPIL